MAQAKIEKIKGSKKAIKVDHVTVSPRGWQAVPEIPSLFSPYAPEVA